MTDDQAKRREELADHMRSITYHLSPTLPDTNRDSIIGSIMYLFDTYLTTDREEAIYGFHEYIVGKNIIRDEVDDAFNYGRLHHAIDDYITELRRRKEEHTNDN